MSAPYKVLSGLSELLDCFDVFVLDQYGVLHNGSVAYPFAVHAFNQLLRHHKKVLLLSNTERRACCVAPKLLEFGFDERFDGVVTSGEEAWRFFSCPDSTAAKGLRKAALVTYDFDQSVSQRATNATSYFHHLDHISIASIDSADFILVEGVKWIFVAGCEGKDDQPPKVEQLSFEQTGVLDRTLERFLKTGLERKLPLFCTNPDLIAIKQHGQIAHMGGKIADFYEQQGGQVVRFGKPHASHFEACVKLAGYTSQKDRVVHIGDSLMHDIQGAKNAGLSSVFIARGIHAEELGLDPSPNAAVGADREQQPPLDTERLDQLFEKEKIAPTFVLREFAF